MNISFISGLRSRWAWTIVASATGALLMIGCLNPETGGVGSGPDVFQDGSSADALDVLVGSGFARERIVEMKGGIVIDGDMYFPKKGLAAGSPASSKGLAKVSQRAARAVNSPAPHTLRLALHSSFAINTTWKSTAHQAVNNLNNLKTRLHIDVVPWGASGDITIYPDESPSCPAELRNLPAHVPTARMTWWSGTPLRVTGLPSTPASTSPSGPPSNGVNAETCR